MKKVIFALLLLGGMLGSVGAQDYVNLPWSASWIGHPEAPATDFAVVHFRHTFTLEELPGTLPVLVSADNRYQLFVNGQRVGEGPARGDLQHWRYETYDLRPYLEEGENVIAAMVWNYGIDRPWSQQSYRTAFLLQPEDPDWASLQTGSGAWTTHHNLAYSPITGSRERLGTYIVTGPQIHVDGSKMPWGWETTDFDDASWVPARGLTRASPARVGTEFYWGLVPREIPLFPRTRPNLRPSIVRAEPDTTRLNVPEPVIPAGQQQKVLLDFRNLTNAFFDFGFSGGKGATVRVEYAESLLDENGEKGNRNEVAGKKMLGVYDEFVLDGGTGRRYTTPWFRTARYVEVTITAREEPVTLEQLRVEEFAYPFVVRGRFEAEGNALRTDEIWEVGWRTARMCAQETYVDCPYYEQLQYVGDTRIQALVSLYVSGDDRLMRKAIQVFEDSRISDGLTQSRYPASVPQVIPPYSLMWVEMVGDYWMHRPDTAFVGKQLRGVRSVLDWYDRQLLPNGLVGPTKFWNFVDWAPEWPWDNVLRVGGVPDMEGGSSIVSLQYLGALRTATELHAYFGHEQEAARYAARARRLAAAIKEHCWNAERGLMMDTPGGKAYSQHANILAILEDIAPASSQKMLERVLTDESLTQVSEYFRFYLIQALYHTDNAYRYPEQLAIWQAYLDQGFTTWPEKPGRTRSDCHAWSASPNYDLPATLAGIRPETPGFGTVSIRPAKTDFGYDTTVPHPEGLIRLVCETDDGKTVYKVSLPEGVSGTFFWKDRSVPLDQAGGKQQVIEVE
ncbi:family 78 glycoside hydrolase catalytic domain [Lewinella sp. W8]|uniref:family 78 glycoside hydrolase catalytic domain n=1 Tax=Lewinella sp. W8 TaxID=2528208 RepID=UPI001564584E